MRVDRWRHSLVGIFLVTAVLVASGRADDRTAAPVLRVGTSGDYQPFSFRDSSGALTGFDVAVAQRLGQDLGRPVTIVLFRWPDLVPQLRADGFDIAMSGVTIQADRAVDAVFSRPYAIDGAVAVIRRGDQQRWRRVDDLDRPGTRIAVNAGGHLEQVARRRFVHARVTAVADNTELPKLLRRGETDAVVSDQLEARAWPAHEVSTIGPFTHDRKAYALPRLSTDLLARVDDWLAAREADGWLNQQRRQWFGAEATLTEEQACVEALVATIELRLQLMPSVAAVKRREHLAVEDPAQEARVIERARAAAATAGLNADDVAALFRVQMEAAKAVERQAPIVLVRADVSLDQLRSAIATASNGLIAELARCRGRLHGRRATMQLDAAVQRTLMATGLPPSLGGRLVAALQHVRNS